MSDESSSGNIMRRRRKEPSESDEAELDDQWRTLLRSFGNEGKDRETRSAYPRGQRLFEIVQRDGRIRLMLDYNEENPAPDFKDFGQRRQVESILGLEKPIENMLAEAEGRWSAGNFEGEAAILEEFAESNPQRDAILELAAEAREDALTCGSSRTRPKRRPIE